MVKVFLDRSKAHEVVETWEVNVDYATDESGVFSARLTDSGGRTIDGAQSMMDIKTSTKKVVRQ